MSETSVCLLIIAVIVPAASILGYVLANIRCR